MLSVLYSMTLMLRDNTIANASNILKIAISGRFLQI